MICIRRDAKNKLKKGMHDLCLHEAKEVKHITREMLIKTKLKNMTREMSGTAKGTMEQTALMFVPGTWKSKIMVPGV